MTEKYRAPSGDQTQCLLHYCFGHNVHTRMSEDYITSVSPVSSMKPLNSYSIKIHSNNSHLWHYDVNQTIKV